MIGLDTNVVIRYVAQDDRAQAADASRIFETLSESNQGYLSTVTLVEIDWVLRGAYRVDRAAAAAVLQGLLESREINVDRPDPVRRALNRVEQGADFANALISELGDEAGCEYTATFDRAAARLSGMRLVET